MLSPLVKGSKFFLSISLTSLIIVSPHLFYPFISGKVFLFRTAIELSCALFLLYIINSQNFITNIKTRLKHPITLAIILFTITYIITSLLGVNPSQSIWSNFERGEGVWQMIHYTLLFLLTTTLYRTKKDWQKLLWFIISITSIIILYAIGQIFGLPGIIQGGTVSGTLGNPSYIAAFLIFTMFFAYWLYTQEQQSALKKKLLILFCIISLFIFYQSYTASAIGALGISTALFIWLISKKWSVRHRIGSFFLIVTTLGIASAIIWYTKNGTIIQNFRPRLWTWGTALAGFLEKPIFGWGFENFPYVFDKYYNPNHFGIESWFDRTHNIFLEYLLAGGIVLLISYLLIYVCFYRTLMKRETRLAETASRGWARNSKLETVMAIVPIFYLIQGQTSFEVLPLYIILFLFFSFFVNYSLGFEENE